LYFDKFQKILIPVTSVKDGGHIHLNRLDFGFHRNDQLHQSSLFELHNAHIRYRD